jgi:hypothetical protein
LGGQVSFPSRRERRKAKKRRRRPAERILRWAIGFVIVVLVVAGLGYGYFRYQWSKVVSRPCTTCVAAANGAPYNVLLIGSDSRAGETAAEAQQFGSAASTAGQRSEDHPSRSFDRHRVVAVHTPRHLRHLVRHGRKQWALQ